MKTTGFLLSALLCTGLLTMNGCKKDEESTSQSEQIAEEETAMDELSSMIDAQIDELAGNDQEASSAPSLKSAATTYPAVTVTFPNETRWPRIITIDYGPENVTLTVGNGANAREVDFRGKIVIEKTGPHFASGSIWDVSFESFYINDNAIEGSLYYKNNGKNDRNNWVFTWTTGLRLTTTDGEWIVREVTKTREMTAGSLTPANIWDDEFTINGTAVGSNSKGWSYTHALANVVVKRLCRFPVSGTITINNTLTTFELDYGDGTCDSSATITDTSGNVTTISLGKRWNK